MLDIRTSKIFNDTLWKDKSDTISGSNKVYQASNSFNV